MTEIIIITLAVALVLVVIIMAIVLYNQLLLLNEVNKRLLVLTKDSIEKERTTQEELQEALRQLDELSNEVSKAPQNIIQEEQEEEIFDPHAYNENL